MTCMHTTYTWTCERICTHTGYCVQNCIHATLYIQKATCMYMHDVYKHIYIRTLLVPAPDASPGHGPSSSSSAPTAPAPAPDTSSRDGPSSSSTSVPPAICKTIIQEQVENKITLNIPITEWTTLLTPVVVNPCTESPGPAVPLPHDPLGLFSLFSTTI